jgi:hypothetical protein
MKYLTLVLISLLMSSVSRATPTYLVDVKTDQTGSSSAYVGYGVDANHTIQTIYFLGMDGTLETFNLSQLKTYQGVFSLAGVNVVSLMAARGANGSVTLTFRYLHDLFSFGASRLQTKAVSIQPDKALTGGYAMFDGPKVVRNIYVTSSASGVDSFQVN